MTLAPPDRRTLVTESSGVVLLLVDVINDLDFPGNQKLLRALPAFLSASLSLKANARRAKVPVIYVNDHFGKWQSSFEQQVTRCLNPDCPGNSLVRQLAPAPQDYFVLKPKHSGFYATTLEVLLDYLKAHTLVLAGIAGDRCVLFTANDAYLRDYRVIIARDCTLSNSPQANRQALELMDRVLHAQILPAARINFSRLRQKPLTTEKRYE